MIRKLGWVAIAGFSVGFVSLIGAYELGGKDLWRSSDWSQWGSWHHWEMSPFHRDCGEDATSSGDQAERCAPKGTDI